MTVSAPGNVLLMGEYAVLEEGGLGAAAAVDLRVRLDVLSAQDLSIEGAWTGGSFAWTPGSPLESPLVSAVVTAVEEHRRLHGRSPVPGQRIRIDSSALYSAGGRKAGYGSSAAVCVALSAALLADVGPGPADRPGNDAAVRLALAAHRSAQGGEGSGYDVYCSFFGGLGLFRGGRFPAWEARGMAWMPHLFLFSGAEPVSTREAISHYRQWKSVNSGEAQGFLERSNRVVERFLASASAPQAASALREGRDLGVELGEAIGVSARIPVPEGLDPDLCKSVGAGNELGVYLCLPGAPEPRPGLGLRRLALVEKGLAWQP